MMARLMHNAGLKFVSLALAGGMWLFVKSITSDSRTIENIPLEIRAKPGMSLVHTTANSVNVVVRGTREDIRQSSREHLSAVLDLTDRTDAGEWRIRLSPRTIRHPSRVQVVDIDPNVVTVRVDQMVE